MSSVEPRFERVTHTQRAAVAVARAGAIALTFYPVLAFAYSYNNWADGGSHVCLNCYRILSFEYMVQGPCFFTGALIW